MVVDAVRDLLGRVPNIDISEVRHERNLESAHRIYQIDEWIDFGHGGAELYAPHGGQSQMGHHASPVPQSINSRAIWRTCVVPITRRSPGSLIPMLVSSYLSPESRSICTDHNVAYLDLFGNAYLAFDNVYIERSVAGRPKSETRALRSIFTPKAAAILRVLLRDPDRAWRVTDLSRSSQCKPRPCEQRPQSPARTGMARKTGWRRRPCPARMRY